MAELVDALVSNTNNFGCAGSTPALGTEAVELAELLISSLFLLPFTPENELFNLKIILISAVR